MPFSYEEFDLSDVKTYPLKSRTSKARVEDFARPVGPGASVGALLDSLPDILAAADFKAVVRAIRDAKRTDGGHRVGAGRARDQDRARPGADRPDGARLRLGDRDQRRRRSSTTSRSRSSAPRQRTSTKRSAPAASAWPRRPDGC